MLNQKCLALNMFNTVQMHCIHWLEVHLQFCFVARCLCVKHLSFCNSINQIAFSYCPENLLNRECGDKQSSKSMECMLIESVKSFNPGNSLCSGQSWLLQVLFFSLSWLSSATETQRESNPAEHALVTCYIQQWILIFLFSAF